MSDYSDSDSGSGSDTGSSDSRGRKHGHFHHQSPKRHYRYGSLYHSQARHEQYGQGQGNISSNGCEEEFIGLRDRRPTAEDKARISSSPTRVTPCIKYVCDRMKEDPTGFDPYVVNLLKNICDNKQYGKRRSNSRSRSGSSSKSGSRSRSRSNSSSRSGSRSRSNSSSRSGFRSRSRSNSSPRSGSRSQSPSRSRYGQGNGQPNACDPELAFIKSSRPTPEQQAYLTANPPDISSYPCAGYICDSIKKDPTGFDPFIASNFGKVCPTGSKSYGRRNGVQDESRFSTSGSRNLSSKKSSRSEISSSGRKSDYYSRSNTRSRQKSNSRSPSRRDRQDKSPSRFQGRQGRYGQAEIGVFWSNPKSAEECMSMARATGWPAVCNDLVCADIARGGKPFGRAYPPEAGDSCARVMPPNGPKR